MTALLFVTVFLPQVALLALFHRSGSAWVNGTFLILEESNLIVAIFFEAFFVDHTQVDIFDAVLISTDHAHLVESRRTVDQEAADPVTALGPRDKGAEFAPFSFRQIIEFVLLLPLNFVPYAGVPLFLFVTGARAGPLLQWRYFQLKAFDKKTRNAFIRVRSQRWQYIWFGTAHLLLQLVPVLSLFFLLTTAVGSALWAADMEDARHENTPTVAEDDPPPYADEP